MQRYEYYIYLPQPAYYFFKKQAVFLTVVNKLSHFMTRINCMKWLNQYIRTSPGRLLLCNLVQLLDDSKDEEC